jgi:hypothetical protein
MRKNKSITKIIFYRQYLDLIELTSRREEEQPRVSRIIPSHGLQGWLNQDDGIG